MTIDLCGIGDAARAAAQARDNHRTPARIRIATSISGRTGTGLCPSPRIDAETDSGIRVQ
ncbi:MAG: hypothetical protein HC937_00225 [Aquincola sp.]|nr:hypothetical protein [Aquincola sp.]